MISAIQGHFIASGMRGMNHAFHQRILCVITSYLCGTKNDPGAIDIGNKTKGNELQHK